MPTTDYPVNLGMACPKGWEALEPLAGRAARRPPSSGRHGQLGRDDWDDALSTMVEPLQGHSGQARPGSVAWLGTGQMRPRSSRFSALSASSGWAWSTATATRGSAWPPPRWPTSSPLASTRRPTPTQDFEQSDVIVLVGANLCIAHPIMWERICRNKHQPADRGHRSAADRNGDGGHASLAVRPKVDLTLLYAIANVLVERGWIDRAYIDTHTTGFEEFGTTWRNSTLRGRREPGSPPSEFSSSPRSFTRASASACGGRWASTKATKACAPRRRSSPSPS